MKLRPPSSFAAAWDQPVWRGYAFAALMLLLAQAGRWLLDPYTGDAMPLATMYIAVAFTVCLFGWQPAALLAIAGYFIGVYVFISPRFTFKITGELGYLRVSVYAVTCTIIILLCET